MKIIINETTYYINNYGGLYYYLKNFIIRNNYEIVSEQNHTFIHINGNKELLESFLQIDKWREGIPPEGVEVIVSDGNNYDVAYYLMSGEYVWMKNNIKKDCSKKFKSFVPIKWKYIVY